MLYDIVKWLLPTTFKAIRSIGYQEAIKDILVFKDKIYTDPVTLIGDNQNISYCTFLGNEYGLKLVSRDAVANEFEK